MTFKQIKVEANVFVFGLIQGKLLKANRNIFTIYMAS